MTRAVVYIRVSTSEQTENHSLSTQERACREFCDRNGLEVDQLFREEGASAKTAERPELQRMIRYCIEQARPRGITTLVVYKLDRLARHLDDHVVIRKQMKSLGITLSSAIEAFDDSPHGILVEGLMALLAQFDNDVRAARTREGMREAARSGRWVWRAPLGYQKPSVRLAARSLEADPARGPLVAAAFHEIASGTRSRASVLDHVTSLGLLTDAGKPVAKQTLQRILTNPIYMGRIVVPRWDLDVPGDFEPLVPGDVFELVQRRLTGSTARIPVRQRDNPDFPLRRAILCEHCGTPLTGSWSQGRTARYAYYRCRTRGLSHLNIRKEQLEELLVAHLAAQSVTPRVLALFRAIVEDVWEERRAARLATEGRMQRELEKLVAKRDRIVEAFIHDHVIDQATYEAHSAGLTQKITEVRREIAGSAATPARDLAATFAFAESLLTDLAGWWRRLDATGKSALLRSIYPSGLTFDGIRFGTAASPLLMPANDDSVPSESREVPPTVPSWNRLDEWLEAAEEARRVLTGTAAALPE